MSSWMITALALVLGLQVSFGLPQAASYLPQIQLPPGFKIALYTNQTVSNARSIAVGGNSTLPIVYVSSNGAGVISAIVDRNQSGSPVVCTLISGLNNPEGLIYVHGSIYVGQVTNVTRYDDVDSIVLTKNCKGLGAPILIASPFPQTSDHNSRHIELGPDNKLYVSYGSPANVDLCGKYNNINSCSIVRMDLNGSNVENYVVGVRNTVGFTWHPDTKEFYFNMIERDLLGDNRPDDVLFRGYGINSNYTWPYCHRQGQGDPYFRNIGPGVSFADPNVYNQAEVAILQSNPANLNSSLDTYCNGTTIPPLMALGPHVTPLGLKFYTGSMFPAEYNRSLFIPEHGSWNRGFLIGYRLVNLKLDSNQNVTEHQIFGQGWLQNENTTAQSVWGRPVATAQLPDGSLLLSDDNANVVYRISYQAPMAPSPAPAVPTMALTTSGLTSTGLTLTG